MELIELIETIEQIETKKGGVIGKLRSPKMDAETSAPLEAAASKSDPF